MVKKRFTTDDTDVTDERPADWLLNKKVLNKILVDMELLYKDLTGKIVDCAVKVHKQLGPGLLESAYEECLHQEMLECGILSVKQVPMPLIYKGRKLELGYRLDLLVEDKVVIEVKSVESLNPVHIAQLMTYLKLSGCKIGLLINFNVVFLKEGIRRFII